MKQHADGAYVYIARGCESGVWKLGVSYDPVTRIGSIAAEARESFEVVAILPGTRDLENELVHRFAHLARPRRREWFDDDGTIAAFVETLPAERRGSYVHTYTGPRSNRTAAEIKAEQRAESARCEAKYLAKHGHPWLLGYKEGCAVCARQLAAARAKPEKPYVYRPRKPVAPLPAFIAGGAYSDGEAAS